MRSVLDILIPRFQASYDPSVDETVVVFRGCFVARQYIPTKPQKYGMKAFMPADSDHRYMLKILVYTGVDTLVKADTRYSLLPQPARVVPHLLDPYLDKGLSCVH